MATTIPNPADTSESSHGWIEVLQVVSVLTLAAEYSLVISKAAAPWAHWILPAVAVAALAAAFLLVRHPKEIGPIAQDSYVITQRRLRTLEALAIPQDVFGAVQDLEPFTGNEEELQRSLFAILGEVRGREHLPTLLPYLRVYVPPVPTRDRESLDDAGAMNRSLKPPPPE
jgi:hypothetical protein